MLCPNCGINNFDEYTNCFNCGYPLIRYSHMVTPQQMYSTPPIMITQTPPQHQYQNPPQQPQQYQPPYVSYPSNYPETMSRPTTGSCAYCNSNYIQFFDNGEGQCLTCGSRFYWREPILNQEQEEKVEQIEMIEENPYIIKKEEILPISERKLEIEPEDEVYHTPVSSNMGTNKKIIEEKRKLEEEKNMGNENRLMLLEIQYSKGDVSKETYENLRKEIINNLLKDLEDRYKIGEISEKEYFKQKEELES